MQGPQDLMSELPDREDVRGASHRIATAARLRCWFPNGLPSDPRPEQVLECLRLFMRARHVGQLGELIKVIRATAARRQPKEQPPRRDQLG